MNWIFFLIGLFVFFFLGLQSAVILFLLHLLRNVNKLNKHAAPASLTDEDEHELELQRERAKAINKDFQKLMSYSVEQALESEKVM